MISGDNNAEKNYTLYIITVKATALISLAPRFYGRIGGVRQMADVHRPAPGLVASTLLTAADAHEKTRPEPVGTGLVSIDHQALNGGFRCGEITSIAGMTGTGKTLIAFQAIASTLLGSEKGDVALIDTTGSFSPLRLRNVMVSRLLKRFDQLDHQQIGYVCEPLLTESEVSKDSMLEEATSLLDRVKVMRVFDFAGVVEAVNEIGEIWEREDDHVGSHPGPKSQERSRVIDDSEEDEASLPAKNLKEDVKVNSTGAASCSEQSDGRSGGIGLVVIDTVTNVISSMVSSNQVQGQAVLTSFMRSLHHLTVRRHICTLLVNSAVGLDFSSNSNYLRRSDDNVSVFSSVPGKPALGKIYKNHIDTSIFLSSIPKTREDAETAYGIIGTAKWNKVNVFEVLSDRYGDREGQWASFEIAHEIETKNAS